MPPRRRNRQQREPTDEPVSSASEQDEQSSDERSPDREPSPPAARRGRKSKAADSPPPQKRKRATVADVLEENAALKARMDKLERSLRKSSGEKSVLEVDHSRRPVHERLGSVKSRQGSVIFVPSDSPISVDALPAIVGHRLKKKLANLSDYVCL